MVNTTESWVILFTGLQFKSTFGRAFNNSCDSISVMNGDAKANNVTVLGVSYYPSDLNLVVALSEKGKGNFRLNYTVVFDKM